MYQVPFSLALMFLAGGAVAQFPMPDSGAVWLNTFYGVEPFPPPAVFTLLQAESYCVDGTDTLINAQTYVQLHYCSGDYKGAFREAEGRVWYLPAGGTQEVLLYHFAPLPGDTLLVYHETPLSGAGQLTQVVVSSVGMAPQWEGRQVVQLNEGGQWIEGIGAAWGLFSEPWMNVSNYLLRLECMSHLDSLRFPTPGPGGCDQAMAVAEPLPLAPGGSAANLHPNPTTGPVHLSSNVPLAYLLLTALDGRRLQVPAIRSGNTATLDLTVLAPGVYLLFTQAHGRAQRVVRE
ncbi:MAG: hypothetical protein KBH07_05730 [Flavobacteriales bacterium]|nr:hypothetical protein [Flavobacteriales bacterium]MBP9078709.1 hypothetical protein [Flavobacteriales bacterium]